MAKTKTQPAAFEAPAGTTLIGSYQIRQSLGNALKPIELVIYDTNGDQIKALQLATSNATAVLTILRSGRTFYDPVSEYIVQQETLNSQAIA